MELDIDRRFYMMLEDFFKCARNHVYKVLHGYREVGSSTLAYGVKLA